MKPVGLADPAPAGGPSRSCSSARTTWPPATTRWSASRPSSSGASRSGCSSMIPALRAAEFVRFGMIHRNTYVNAPSHARADASRRAARRACSSPARCRASRATWSRRPPGCSPASARPRPRARRRASGRLPRGHGAWAPWAGTSREAIPPTTSPPTSLSACCRNCRQRVRDKAQRRLALSQRALDSLGRLRRPARSARGPSAARRLRQRLTRAACRDAGGPPVVPAPPGPRAQRLRAHGPGLRRRPPSSSSPTCGAELGREPRPADVDHAAHPRASWPGSTAPACKKTSAARKLASLRTFFRYLCREGILDRNPARALLSPRLEQRDPGPPRRGRGDAPSSACQATATPAALRARAILELLYAHRHPLRRAGGAGPGRRWTSTARVRPRARQGTEGTGGPASASRAETARPRPTCRPRGAGRPRTDATVRERPR